MQKGKSRAVFILFGLFFGHLGVHDFYAGHTARGWTHLCIEPISLYLLWTSNGILVIWGICLLIVNNAWAFLESLVIKEDGNGVPME